MSSNLPVGGAGELTFVSALKSAVTDVSVLLNWRDGAVKFLRQYLGGDEPLWVRLRDVIVIIGISLAEEQL